MSIFKVFCESQNYLKFINLKLDPKLTMLKITHVRKRCSLNCYFQRSRQVYQNICSQWRPGLQVNSSICFGNHKIKFTCHSFGRGTGQRNPTPLLSNLTLSQVPNWRINKLNFSSKPDFYWWNLVCIFFKLEGFKKNQNVYLYSVFSISKSLTNSSKR